MKWRRVLPLFVTFRRKNKETPLHLELGVFPFFLQESSLTNLLDDDFETLWKRAEEVDKKRQEEQKRTAQYDCLFNSYLSFLLSFQITQENSRRSPRKGEAASPCDARYAARRLPRSPRAIASFAPSFSQWRATKGKFYK